MLFLIFRRFLKDYKFETGLREINFNLRNKIFSIETDFTACCYLSKLASISNVYIRNGTIIDYHS